MTLVCCLAANTVLMFVVGVEIIAYREDDYGLEMVNDVLLGIPATPVLRIYYYILLIALIYL